MSYITIAETNNFIVLDKYDRNKIQEGRPTKYQSEAELEQEFIADLVAQGYLEDKSIRDTASMLQNIKVQLEYLNSVTFNNSEWKRFVEEYLNNPNENSIARYNKIHKDNIKDFTFDNGEIKNIKLIDKKNITRNKLQVINQFSQKGSHLNRYDVTILVNGLPLVQVELKKRGVHLEEAFNQVHRYSKESFNSDNSLYKYIQMFVISNGTQTLYFANTTKREKKSFAFTMTWATSDNNHIDDLKDFTATFFQKNVLLNILFRYTILNTDNTLLIMRPYQIAATERILQKINSTYNTQRWSQRDSGGYIWHTTGSGKTLTSFKTAQMATELDFVDKVLFVVDRKDLDEQTMREYKKFSEDSVSGTSNTSKLRESLCSSDKKIIVTTIQKLNVLVRKKENLPVYKENVVLIFDEAHRSQFGEAQRNIRRKFKKYVQFGFTGTPIKKENSNGLETTESVFGNVLHQYLISHAIKDQKVLRFKVDYNSVNPHFKNAEKENAEERMSASEVKDAFLHPGRIKSVAKHILNNFNIKTHRRNNGSKGFNAMFTVFSIDAAKCYYNEFKKLQKDSEKPLKIATIFSYAPNEGPKSEGETNDESLDTSQLDITSKNFLSAVIQDYNEMFGTSYGINGESFENYYKDISKKMKANEIDLLIVVGMFLTGFDAPCLNTLFVDKNLKYHGLLQAFSRTNRILDSTKAFGNIVTFRDLEKETNEAITTFCSQDTINLVLERKYKDYLEGFEDDVTSKSSKGYINVVKDLEEKFPLSESMSEWGESAKFEFAKLFGEFLIIENILRNYDEFHYLKKFNDIPIEKRTEENIKNFKDENFLTDEDMQTIQNTNLLSDRDIQDYTSRYKAIRKWIIDLREQEKQAGQDGQGKSENLILHDDVVFQIDLLNSVEINYDYILGLIYDKNKERLPKDQIIEEACRLIRSSLRNDNKEDLIINFIKLTNLDDYLNRADLLEAFYAYAKREKNDEENKLIKEENLNEESAKYYISKCLDRGYAYESGTDLKDALPRISPMDADNYDEKKNKVFEKISEFVKKFSDL